MVSLLLPGVELPQKGVMLRIAVSGDGFFSVVVDDWPTATGKAVEVPEHGALIDADELRAEHGLGGLCENCPVDKRDCQYKMTLTKMEVCGWVDDAKIIIPASRRADNG